MRALRVFSVSGVALVGIVPACLIVTAPNASAECTETGGITMCQNEVRRAETGPADQDIWYPYPCEYDYLCDDGVSVFDYDSDIDPPDNPGDRPDIGLPGRPGDRPDRPDRPGGGGGIGGR